MMRVGPDADRRLPPGCSSPRSRSRCTGCSSPRSRPSRALFASPPLVPARSSLDHYRALFDERDFWTPIRNSLIVAGRHDARRVAARRRLRVRARAAAASAARRRCSRSFSRSRCFRRSRSCSPLYLLLRELRPAQHLSRPGAALPHLCDAAARSGCWSGFFRQLPRELEDAALDGRRAPAASAVRHRAAAGGARPRDARPSSRSSTAGTSSCSRCRSRSGRSATPCRWRSRCSAAQYQVPWGQILAAAVVATVPVAALVLACQRRIVAGLTSGAGKGLSGRDHHRARSASARCIPNGHAARARSRRSRSPTASCWSWSGRRAAARARVLRLHRRARDADRRAHRHRRRRRHRRAAAASATWRWCSRATRSTRTRPFARTSRSACRCADVAAAAIDASACAEAAGVAGHRAAARSQAGAAVGRPAAARRARPRASCASRRRFCSTSRCRTSIRRCARDARAELALLHRRLGATMVYVTHDQEEAMTLGTRVAVMRDGAIEQVAPPLEVYSPPGEHASWPVHRVAGDEPARGVDARHRRRRRRKRRGWNRCRHPPARRGDRHERLDGRDGGTGGTARARFPRPSPALRPRFPDARRDQQGRRRRSARSSTRSSRASTCTCLDTTAGAWRIAMSGNDLA